MRFFVAIFIVIVIMIGFLTTGVTSKGAYCKQKVKRPIIRTVNGQNVTQYESKTFKTCCPGYTLLRGKCVAFCEKLCENSKCTAPNKCTCRKGYRKSTDFRCEPKCDGCKYGFCSAPGLCECYEGYEWSKMTDECLPKCDPPCVNGFCSNPGSCSCHDGYQKVEDNSNICVSITTEGESTTTEAIETTSSVIDTSTNQVFERTESTTDSFTFRYGEYLYNDFEKEESDDTTIDQKFERTESISDRFMFRYNEYSLDLNEEQSDDTTIDQVFERTESTTDNFTFGYDEYSYKDSKEEQSNVSFDSTANDVSTLRIQEYSTITDEEYETSTDGKYETSIDEETTFGEKFKFTFEKEYETTIDANSEDETLDENRTSTVSITKDPKKSYYTEKSNQSVRNNMSSANVSSEILTDRGNLTSASWSFEVFYIVLLFLILLGIIILIKILFKRYNSNHYNVDKEEQVKGTVQYSAEGANIITA